MSRLGRYWSGRPRPIRLQCDEAPHCKTRPVDVGKGARRAGESAPRALARQDEPREPIRIRSENADVTTGIETCGSRLQVRSQGVQGRPEAEPRGRQRPDEVLRAVRTVVSHECQDRDRRPRGQEIRRRWKAAAGGLPFLQLAGKRARHRSDAEVAIEPEYIPETMQREIETRGFELCKGLRHRSNGAVAYPIGMVVRLLKYQHAAHTMVESMGLRIDVRRRDEPSESINVGNRATEQAQAGDGTPRIGEIRLIDELASIEAEPAGRRLPADKIVRSPRERCGDGLTGRLAQDQRTNAR